MEHRFDAYINHRRSLSFSFSRVSTSLLSPVFHLNRSSRSFLKMPSMKSGLALLFAAAAVASPNPLVDRNGGVNCAALNTIVTILHEQAVCTPFCSSYLHISTVTSTQTSTSTPSPVTTTTTVSSTDTVTTTTFSTSSGVTTVYPVVAVSTTSTCALGATVVQSSSSNVNVKRETPCTTSAPPPPPSSIPIGTPLALTGFVQTDVSSACSCLNIPTPTKIVTTTTTLTTNTVSLQLVEDNSHTNSSRSPRLLLAPPTLP